MNKRISLYWHTLRHLRPVQVYGRVAFRVYRPRPDPRAAPPRRDPSGVWVAPARRDASLLGPGEFRFLGVEGSLDRVGWDGPHRDKLWRYNQHYFDDLNAIGAADRSAWHASLLTDWVDSNPPANGNGWEPYPTSLRIVNWIKWTMAGNRLPDQCIHSLAVQARWLSRRLERHLLGNHLFANAKALVFAGLFFGGEEAGRWLEKGLRLLDTEVGEQILADGGHFERSPMYQSIVLEDLLDLCNLASTHERALPDRIRNQAGRWRDIATDMFHWLDTMCHPDGEIAFFNDAAIGIAPSPAELMAYGDRLGVEVRRAQGRLTWLRDSGYARLASGPALLLLDMAPVGPDYLPGHAHADTLSFELSLFGSRVVVNSGTSCYGDSAERLRQRSTPAHNTVVLDGENSSEVWHGFRVARRAFPLDPQVKDGEELEASSAHDGYLRIPARVIHRRRWRLGAGELLVEDSLQGGACHAEARYHFHPTVAVEVDANGRRGTLRLSDGRRVGLEIEAGRARVEHATWHPGFGVCERNACLVVAASQASAKVRLVWGEEQGRWDAHSLSE